MDDDITCKGMVRAERWKINAAADYVASKLPSLRIDPTAQSRGKATPGGSIASMAKGLGWFNTTGKPAKSRVYRAIEKLCAAKLVTKGRGDDSYVLTAAGKEEARKCS